jgi:AraC family transcriptional regulator
MGVYHLIKLLRMKRAAYQLIFRPQMKIIDIGVSNGFDSHQAFSRSFRHVIGVTPSAYRKAPDWSSWQHHFNDITKIRVKTMNATDYVIDIIDFPEISLAVYEHKGAPELLGRSIQRFIEWRKAMKLPPTKSRTFNLVYDDPRMVKPEDYRFDLACEYGGDDLRTNTEMVCKTIPAGKCARYRHLGSDDTLSCPIEYMYSGWLDDSDYALRDFPLFFERVSFFPEVPEYEMITDIYLPII